MLIPILWRYLLEQYFKVLILCTLTFVAVLLTTRLEEIAHFAALGPQAWQIFAFIFYQIPYILPIALPIASLISATLLVQRLSKNYELTAFRASGLALRDLLAPILIGALCLSTFNFYLISEFATTSHLKSGILKNELRTINPLLMLTNKHLMNVKGFHFEILGTSRYAESATDVILAFPNKHYDRMNLFVAKKLHTTLPKFTANDITLISSMGAKNENEFDHLIVENIGEAQTTADDFLQMIQKKAMTWNYDHLQLSLLLLKLQEDKQALSQATGSSSPDKNIVKSLKQSINRSYSEILRRLSIAFAVFSFTLMGAAFGITISRNRSYRGLVSILSLATLYLLAYFTAKALDHLLIATALLYVIPHVIIVTASIWTLKRTSTGIE